MNAVDHLVMFAGSVAGPVVALWLMWVLYYRTNREQAIARHILLHQLVDYAKWSHKAIREICFAMSLDVDAAPKISGKIPPASPSPGWDIKTNPGR